MGFSATTPLLGKEQKYVFYLIDVVAVFKLPWSWQLGENPWNLETRLLTSAGVLTGASEKALMMTAVPGLPEPLAMPRLATQRTRGPAGLR